MRDRFSTGIEAEVSNRMVTFQTALRQPEEDLVNKLYEVVKTASQDVEGLAAYQIFMSELFALPGRAKADNRLHRKKGCRFCETPCTYGFFSLVSEPRFELLQHLLEAEKGKAPEEKNAVSGCLDVCAYPCRQTSGSSTGFISAAHLGNLAYCLLMLSMAKSRYPLPEAQMKAFQARNQQMVPAGNKSRNNWGLLIPGPKILYAVSNNLQNVS